MKEHNHIDALFQQHFAETTVVMPNQEALWQRIFVKKDDKSRGFFWLAFIGFLLISGVAYALIQNNNTQTNAHTALAITDNNIASSANYPLPKQTNNSTILPITNKVLESPTNSNSNSNSKVNKTQIFGQLTSKNINTTEVIPNHSSLNISEEIEALSTIYKNEEATPIKNQLITAINASQATQKALNISDINSIGLQLLESKERSKPFSISDTDSWSRCEVKTPGHFFVDAYGQAGLPMDDITLSQAGSDQFAYRDLWDQRFDPKASWHGGLAIGYEFPIGLRISAGLEYQELVTQYSDNQTITEMIRVWDPQAYFTFDNMGNRVWVGDTVTAINIYERKIVQKNKHTLLNIPVQLSYDIYKRPGFHIAADVAAILNISKDYEGQFLRSDQSLIIVDNNNQDNFFTTDIGVSIAAGLHFGYYLNDDWEVYASPRFRYNSNSYLLDTEILKITRNIFGIRGGVRYHF